MAIQQKRSKRKVSGGRYKKIKKKKLYCLGSLPRATKVSETKRLTKRVLGGNLKTYLLSSNIINVYNPKTKKYQKSEIETILENPANRHFVRRNILTKGSIVKTKLGKAKVTSRPGQEGTINAILVE
ncbi:30S ribosomal protein S8e [archaeon]|nr:30S ribosomal protein S8e [archaeon]